MSKKLLKILSTVALYTPLVASDNIGRGIFGDPAERAAHASAEQDQPERRLGHFPHNWQLPGSYSARAEGLAARPQVDDHLSKEQDSNVILEASLRLSEDDRTMILGIMLKEVMDRLNNLPPIQGGGIRREERIRQLARCYLDHLKNNPQDANNEWVRMLNRHIKTYYNRDVFSTIIKMKKLGKYLSIPDFPEMRDIQQEEPYTAQHYPNPRSQYQAAPAAMPHHIDPMSADEAAGLAEAMRLQAQFDEEEREARNRDAALGEREAQRLARYEQARRAAYEADLPLRREREIIDHTIALMFDAVNQVERGQNLPEFSNAMESVIGLYAQASEQDRQQINGAMLNMHELSYDQNRNLMNRVRSSMDFVREILQMQRVAREERDRIERERQDEQRREEQRLEAQRREEQRREEQRLEAQRLEAQRLEELRIQQARDAERLEEANRLERERAQRIEEANRLERERAAAAERIRVAQARPDVKNAWDIESFDGEPAIHFEMPRELEADAQELVRFFMNHVNPKLIDLLKSRRLSNAEYNGVLRSFSMGVLGLVHADGYADVAKEKKEKQFNDANRSNSKDLGYIVSLINLSDVTNKDLRLQNVTDANPLLAGLARNAGFNGRSITTFMALHTEDMQSAVDKRLKAILNGGQDDSVAAIDEYSRGIKERILILPGVLRGGFEALISQGGTDGQWVDFAKASSSYACYDGTTDPIIGKKLEQEQQLRIGAVENSFAPLVEKIRNDVLRINLPGARHGEVPGFTDVLSTEVDDPAGNPVKEGFFPTLEAVLPVQLKNLTAANIDTQNKKDAIDRAYAHFRAAHFMGKTFLRIGIKAELIPHIYNQLGLRPGTSICLYSDEDILELMFWIEKQNEAIAEGNSIPLMPPMVATKFGIEQ